MGPPSGGRMKLICSRFDVAGAQDVIRAEGVINYVLTDRAHSGPDKNNLHRIGVLIYLYRRKWPRHDQYPRDHPHPHPRDALPSPNPSMDA